MAQDPAQTSLIGDQATAPATQSAAGPAAPAPAEPTAAAASDPGPGAMVGPWQLRRLLGRGGMGAVYLAERTRQDFQQRAALKLIKLGMDSGEIQQRFLAERRILARLEHPNIARLIDGGVDQSGRPYFVMEWVDGLPLIEYADSHDLDVPARLKLFLKLCDAVAHAHRQLVVHRDLKPGNILVDARGEPRLLDFGIAKVLESDREHDTSATGQRFFTRAYAAPEQMRGEPVSTATDIYALGAVLFELLTGAALHSARMAGTDTRDLLSLARRRAGDEGPAAVKPSALGGDLALVVAKAVRAEPQRRYASTEAFADDLRACLDGRPVRARPDTFGYRAQRFIRRHWIGVGAVAAVVVAVIAGVAIALWQARIARQEALHAEAVSGFLSEVFESATPEGAASGDITARSLLERGSQRIERELAAEPAVRARLYASLARAWFYIGDYARAAEMYESGRALVGADNWLTEVTLLRGLAQTELAMGQLKLARTHVDMALQRLAAAAPDDALEHARTLSVAKSITGFEGDPARARVLAGEVYATLEQRLGADDEETLLALNDLGTWTLESGDARGALDIFGRVVAERRRISGADHPELATAMHNRVLALSALGEIDDALTAAGEVVALRRQILPPLHRDLARSLGAEANLESRRGNYRRAGELRREALTMLRAQRRPDQLLLGQELTNQATDVLRLGDLASARADLTEAIERLRPQLGADDPRVLAASSYLGLVEVQLGELQPAIDRLRAISQRESEATALRQRLATRRYLARALRWQGKPGEALDALAPALAWPVGEIPRQSATARGKAQTEYALALIEVGDRPAAERAIDAASRAFAENGAVGAEDTAQMQLARARLALATGDAQGALRQAELAQAALLGIYGPAHFEVGEAQGVLAMARWRGHRGADAREAVAAAANWYREQRPWHPDAAVVQKMAAGG
jgi:tetratricopeptide (TPR) repeat protein/tRNA A-37 threonylcarbamoyl transferase component Bud32